MTRSLLALAALTAGVASAADWPQWRGPNRDGKSADTGLLKEWPKDGPKLLWSNEAVGTGYGTPAVVGDKLYLVGAESPKAGAAESLVCLSAADGKELWRSPLPTSEARFNDRWGGGPRSTPTADGDRLYVLGASGDLHCLAAADGKVVWTKSLTTDFGGKVPTWGYSESPLIDGDRVICTPGGDKGAVVALDKKTGETAWQSAEVKEQAGYSSVIVAEVGGVKQYLQQTMQSGFGVRASDGKLLWQVKGLGRRTAVIPTPVFADGYAFFTAGYAAGSECYKLEPAGDGTKAVKVYAGNKNMSNKHGGVVQLGDYIYGYNGEREGWTCIEFKKSDADVKWNEQRALGFGSVTYADGHLYCYTEDKGMLARIKATPEKWQEVGRFSIPKTSKTRPGPGKVWPHPVVANGKLFLRDYDLLFCYDVKGGTAVSKAD